MLVPFIMLKRYEAVAAIFRQGITLVFEFMERDALIWTQKFTNNQSIHVADIRGTPINEVDGFDSEVLKRMNKLLMSLMI